MPKQTLSVLYLNQDDNPESLPVDPQNSFGYGDSPYILNIRTGPSEDNDGGKAKNVRGNTEALYDLPAGENKTIGYTEDLKANRLLIYNYNSLGNHQILKYQDGAVSVLMEGPELAFEATSSIHSSNVVDDMDYWSENSNEPRKINIEQASDSLQEHEIYFGAIADTATTREISVSATRDGVPILSLPAFIIAPVTDLQE
jgi:hypothetical protein